MKVESSPKTHTWKTEKCETSIPLDDCGLNNASIKLEGKSRHYYFLVSKVLTKVKKLKTIK